MTDRKPDFYVLKRIGLDDVPEWFTFDADGHVWDYQLTMRHRFVTEDDAAKIAKKYGGSVVPVFCTSKRTEPKMRGHSFSWALARMKEGKRVRMARWVSAAYVYVRENTPYFVNETKSDFRPDFCHIMANDWELAE